jgi:hypothetical protein
MRGMENEQPKGSTRSAGGPSFTEERTPCEAAVFAAIFVGTVAGAAGVIITSIPVIVCGLALVLVGMGLFICRSR